MALDRCVFAARVPDVAHRAALETRLARLVDFYRVLGSPRLSFRWLDRLGAMIGVIDFCDRAHRLDRPLTWGGSLPRQLATNDALLSAGRVELRRLDGVIGVIAASDQELCVIEGASTGFPVFHQARSSVAEVWSSHAVAAAWLASGLVALDPEAVVEFIAYHFLGGDRSMIRGVTIVDCATRVRIDRGGVSREAWWPARERWTLVPEADAYEHTEAALFESIARRIDAQPVVLGLTAGLDSRVTAVAMRTLDVPFEAVTVGTAGNLDVDEAAVVARALGLRHRIIGVEPALESTPAAAADAHARWNDGAGRAAAVRASADLEAATMVTGGGGETGRCLLYRMTARNYRRPTKRQLAQVITPTGQFDSARTDVVRLVEQRSAEAVADAYSIGQRGWRALDVVAAEGRIRRVYRALSTPGTSDLVVAFCTPDVQRGLASLPLETRLSDGFHRRFIARHAPAVAPGPGPSQRAGLPPAARRVASTVRRQRERRLNSAPIPLAAELRDWLTEVLASQIVVEPFGPAWVDRRLAGVKAGHPEAIETALFAAGPVALSAALDQARFA